MGAGSIFIRRGYVLKQGQVHMQRSCRNREHVPKQRAGTGAVSMCRSKEHVQKQGAGAGIGNQFRSREQVRE